MNRILQRNLKVFFIAALLILSVNSLDQEIHKINPNQSMKLVSLLTSLHHQTDCTMLMSSIKKLKIHEQHYYFFQRFNIQVEATHHLNILEEEYLLKHFKNRIPDCLL